MSIVNFENVKVTTMTVVVNFIGDVNIETAFSLLPITRLELKETKPTKKFKIPWPGSSYKGAIFSARYAGITRGIIKSFKKKSFRNSVGIEICTSGKNISAKLSKNKIHMCGANSVALAQETAEHIINHLTRIQKELDYISNHVSERDDVIRWLIKETKGDLFTINEETQEIIELEEGEKIKNSIVYDRNGNKKYNFRELTHFWEEGDSINSENILIDKNGQPYFRSLTKKEKKDGFQEYPLFRLCNSVKISNEKDHRIFIDEKGGKINKVVRFPLRALDVTSVKIPSDIVTTADDIIFSKNINPRIAKFLIYYIQDYAYHHVLTEFLNNFKDITHIYKSETNELTLENMNIAMINYSYSLGMNIDRWRLTQLIDGYKGKFNATYNNTTDHHVTISVPYEANKNEIIKRKSQNNCISFMIYRSGIVTQSGPSPELMKESYYDFMNFINNVRDEISIKDGKPVSLKYKPTSLEDVMVL